ncbi:hypothetical protein M758_4G032700 [Ceratodon purpureus]|nr:hypothetical protein M758_4G032700 [Ceratodon purpureus]
MAGRMVVELESIHLTVKKPYFKGLKAFAVLQYKNEEKRGQPRKLLGMVSNWGESFDFSVEGNPKADCIWMDVYKEKSKRDQLIGRCKILLYEATTQRGEPSRATLPVTADVRTEDNSKDSNMGHLTVLVRYYPSAPLLEAALQKAEERVLKLERELQLKLEHQRAQNVGEAASSSGNTTTTLMHIDSLAATISKVEQLRFQTQIRKLENEMKWAENDARWAENRGKWAANDIKWEENDVNFAVNNANWAENDIKWAENNIKWHECEAKSAEIQAKLNQGILGNCQRIVKADLLNLGYNLKVLLVGAGVWITSKMTNSYERLFLEARYYFWVEGT